MALDFTQRGTQTFVNNVYQGQKRPFRFGKTSQLHDLSPNFLAFSNQADTLNISAYYDPYKSPYFDSSSPSPTLKNGMQGFLTYIQVGAFKINSIPFPIQAYLPYNPYPTYIPRANRSFVRKDWIDISAKDSNESIITNPFYPLWELENDASKSFNSFFKYPQRFGSLVKVGETLNTGEYQAAHLNGQVELNLGLFPTSADLEAYFKQVDTSGLEVLYTFPDEFTSGGSVSSDPDRYVQHLIQAEIIPPVTRKHYYIQGDGRVFFRYETTPNLPGRPISETDEDTQYWVPTLFYTLAGKTVVSYLDEDYVEDFQEELITNGPPDVAKLSSTFKAATEMDSRFDGNIEFRYDFITYPCFVWNKIDGKKMYVKQLEGFYWEATRLFDSSAQSWGPIGIKKLRLTSTEKYQISDIIFKRNVQHYYASLPSANQRLIEWL